MKKCEFKKLKNKKGSALLVAFLLIVVLVIVGSVSILMTVSELRTAERQFLANNAFHIAEAGIERVLYDMRMDYENDSTPSWQDNDINGVTFDLSTTVTTFLTSTFSDGSYVVTLHEGDSSEHAWIRSTATVGDVTQTVELYVKLVDVSPWDNAIFAGSGAAGSMVNGNVDVRGSVHILGSGLTSTDLAIDLGGTAEFVGNNYSGLSASLAALVPALPTTTFNGEVVETLNAELRVKSGQIGLSGSSTVGETDVFGDGDKETVDNVFVTDGWSGTSGSSSVYSDNGTTAAYDLGNSVVFPSLSDPAPENSLQTVQEYFESNALVLTTELSSLNPNSSFSYTDGTNSISMDGSGNLSITGRVYIDGGNSVGLSKQGPNKTITYSGTGTILAEGDIQIDVNLVTSGANSFPTNIMGFMTPQDIGFNEANIDVMGVFYGENQIQVQKQTDMMGTIVSNYFDVGTNVPAIYQVPEVSNNLPIGMIGANAYAFVIEMWRRE